MITSQEVGTIPGFKQSYVPVARKASNEAGRYPLVDDIHVRLRFDQKRWAKDNDLFFTVNDSSIEAGHKNGSKLVGRAFSQGKWAADYVPNAFDAALKNAAEAAVKLTDDWKLVPGRTYTLPQYVARSNFDQFIYPNDTQATVFSGPDMRNIKDHEFNMVVAQPGDKKDVIISGDLRNLDSYPDEVANAVRSALEFTKVLDK